MYIFINILANHITFNVVRIGQEDKMNDLAKDITPSAIVRNRTVNRLLIIHYQIIIKIDKKNSCSCENICSSFHQIGCLMKPNKRLSEIH